MSNLKRVNKEFKNLSEYINNGDFNSHRYLNIKSINQNNTFIELSFLGPIDTPYEEIINIVTIDIPDKYPNTPPTIKFKNNLFHPNISQHDGGICLDILKDKWSPVYTLETLMTSIISLLSEPNPDSPLNGDAAKMYIDSLSDTKKRRLYKAKILELSEKKFI